MLENVTVVCSLALLTETSYLSEVTHVATHRKQSEYAVLRTSMAALYGQDNAPLGLQVQEECYRVLQLAL